MRVLYISNLFPDSERFSHGIFNARLTRYLSRLCDVQVISPRPRLPFCRRAVLSACKEDLNTQPVYPPVFYIPIIGTPFNHWLMAVSLRKVISKTIKDFDVVLGAWIYPDCCGVAILSRELRFPFVVTALGSDVHQYLKMPLRRKIIVKYLNSASAIISCSKNLAQLLAEAGLPTSKLYPIYYGVDQDVFKPGDKIAARNSLGFSLNESVILYVGNLLGIKNPLMLLEAFLLVKMSNPQKRFRLVYIGDGELKKKLEVKIREKNLTDSVVLAGRKKPGEVATYMQAADLLCLTSTNEGVPNVVLEALATGLPVVATRVGGVPEILDGLDGCRLVPAQDIQALATAIGEILSEPKDSAKLVEHSKKYAWETTAQEYYGVLQKAIKNGAV